MMTISWKVISGRYHYVSGAPLHDELRFAVMAISNEIVA